MLLTAVQIHFENIIRWGLWGDVWTWEEGQGTRGGGEERGLPASVSFFLFLSHPPPPFSSLLRNEILGGIEVNTNHYQSVIYPGGTPKHKPLLP